MAHDNCRDLGLPSSKKWRVNWTASSLEPQRVRIHQAAGNYQRIEVIRSRVVQCKINIEFVALVGVMHALNLAGL